MNCSGVIVAQQFVAEVGLPFRGGMTVGIRLIISGTVWHSDEEDATASLGVRNCEGIDLGDFSESVDG
jgi:hypothetical protein